MARPSDNVYQVNVGRRGITDGLIVEIARQLEERKTVKVKLLKIFTDPLERDEIDSCFETIEQLVDEILDGELPKTRRRGFTKTYTLAMKRI